MRKIVSNKEVKEAREIDVVVCDVCSNTITGKVYVSRVDGSLGDEFNCFDVKCKKCALKGE